MQILVNNNRAGMIQITHTKGEQTLNLSPGVNSVALAVWEKCREQQIVQLLMRTKVEIIKGRTIDPETVGKMQIVEGKTCDDDAGLKGITPKTCESVIDATLDPRLLAKWAADEKRADVRAMVEARIKALTPEPTRKAG